MPNKLTPTEPLSFETILRSSMGWPGIRIDRAKFLEKELSKHYEEAVVYKAIDKSPAHAGIDADELEDIAKACINYETIKATALSSAAGIPGGLAVVATIPVDTAQFFGHILRIIQKLAYLYGWPELLSSVEDFDDKTTNLLTLFVGVMFGVSAANTTLSKIAGLAALNVPKKLLQQALTKGTIYPIVKKIAAAIGVKMTKTVFANGVGKIIPIAGAVVSGGLTFAFFKPMATKLKKHLADLPMASVEFYNKSQSNDIVIDVDFSDIPIEADDDKVEV
jgi:hypothetical protein